MKVVAVIFFERQLLQVMELYLLLVKKDFGLMAGLLKRKKERRLLIMHPLTLIHL